MMILAFLLATQAVSDSPCVKRPTGWACQSEWVAALPKTEQRAVLALLHGGLKLELQAGNSNVKTKRDACWWAGTAAYGQAMLMMGATKNDDVRRFFAENSETFRKMAIGELTGEAGLASIVSKPNPFSTFSGNPRFPESIGDKYKVRYMKAESALFSYSKIAASNMPECR